MAKEAKTQPDERPMPKVNRVCGRCDPDWNDTVLGRVVVSPTGVSHIGEDYGVTRCGLDATGPNWWWPL